MSKPTLSTIAGVALIVLPLAFVAGYLGSLVGSPGPVDPSPTAPARRINDGSLSGRVNELERRLQALEGHGLKETAEQALQLATTNERRIEALERRGPAAPVESGAATPVKRKTQAERIEEQATLSFEEQAHRIGIKTTHQVLLHHLNLFGKFDEKGAADRKTQALSDAQRVAGAWKMDQDKAREIYLSSMDRYATEVGPLLGDGVKSADLETVRARYRGVTVGD